MRLILKCAVGLVAAMSLASCEVEPPVDYEALALERGAAVVAECAAVRCERLDLDGARLADFSVLNGMDHVTALMVSYSNFDDLADIAGMTQLTELHIGSTQVADLSGLSVFENLRLLHAQGLYTVEDFTPLHQMTGLSELAIDVPEDGSIGYIAGLTQLETLSILSGTIGDLAPLAGHPSLRVLNIEAGVPEDTSALLSMPRLQEISLNFWAVDDATRQALTDRGVAVLAVPGRAR